MKKKYSNIIKKRMIMRWRKNTDRERKRKREREIQR